MYKLNSEILEAAVEDNSMLVLDPVKGEYYELNQTSVFILDLIKKGFSKPEIIDAMFAEYDCSLKQIGEDFETLIVELKQSNILL